MDVLYIFLQLPSIYFFDIQTLCKSEPVTVIHVSVSVVTFELVWPTI